MRKTAGTLCIATATWEEARPVLAVLKDARVTTRGSTKVWSGAYRGLHTVVYITGIGRRCASEAAAHISETAGCRAVLNIGIAGSLVPAVPLGEWYEIIRVSAGHEGAEPYDLNSVGLWPQTTLITATQPVCTREDSAVLRARTGAELVDMECYYLGREVRGRGVSYYSMKMTSDRADADALRVVRQSLAAYHAGCADKLQLWVDSFKRDLEE